jgi:hypothetical protein
MQVVTDDEMREFLSKHADLRCEGRSLLFDHPEAKAIYVDLRVKEPHQLIYLARLAAHLRYEEIHFGGASLWLTQWGVWSDLAEAVAVKAMERIRQGYGENRSLNTAPGHFFRHCEFVESVACLVQPMLVGWDAYYVPQWAWGSLDYFLFISHDGFLDIQTRTTEMHDQALEILKSHDWLVSAVRSRA